MQKDIYNYIYNYNMPRGYNKNGTPRIPPSRKGVKLTKEQKSKLGSGWRGKKRPPFSKEWKDKISKTLLRKYASGELKIVVTLEQRIQRSKRQKERLIGYV